MGREGKHVSGAVGHLFLQLSLGRVMQFGAANCKINGTVQIFNPIKVLHEMLTVACMFFQLANNVHVCVCVLQNGLRAGKEKNTSHTVTDE